MTLFIARARVLATSLVAWFIAAAVAITALAGELAQILPEHAETIGTISVRVLTGIAVIVAVLRRVTPVPPAQRGILDPTEEH